MILTFYIMPGIHFNISENDEILLYGSCKTLNDLKKVLPVFYLEVDIKSLKRMLYYHRIYDMFYEKWEGSLIKLEKHVLEIVNTKYK